MLQRIVSLILACLLVLSLAGCGAGPEPEAAVPAVQTEVPAVETTEVVTEPTLSAEEVLIASLPEKVKQAYDLGLVDLELLSDLDRICLGAEAAEIIQNIHVAHHGTESKIMNQLFESEHADIEVTRFWLAHTMFLAEAETVEEAPCETYMENYQHMMKALVKNNGMNDLSSYIYSHSGNIIHINNVEDWWWYEDYEHDAVISAGDPFMPDFQEVLITPELAEEQELYVNCTDLTPDIITWVTLAYDRLTGEKIIFADETTPFLPREKMTVREVVETTLRYYNWIPPQQELLAYEELPTYDTSIITDELLNKVTTLPEASCQHLPESWRGIDSRVMFAPDSNKALADQKLQPNEIQVMKDAGFNFLRLHLDFKYFSSDDLNYWPGWMTDPKLGYMNETRLKEVDQVIAWCIERDIHVNLVCDGFVGWNPSYAPPFDKEHQGKNLGSQWAVFARRYADIPNTYLSFTMHDEPGIWVRGQYRKFFTPVVKAIQEVSPDRCIIADIGGRGDPGEDMAKLGVALSTKAYWPEAFHLKDKKTADRIAFLESATWPYAEGDTVYDAEAAMIDKRYNCDSPDEVAAVAEEYGVGFMVSGWAPTMGHPEQFLRVRYSDETMQNYLNDFATVLKNRGYGWCYGDHNGFTGLFAAYPVIESTTYTQVDNAPLYIDDEMFAWLQAINTAQ